MTINAAARWALISVSDKEGVAGFAQRLSEAGFGLISTGGTAAALRKVGLEVRDVADITGFPEMMDGRVKTLHPRIHGGLLGLRGENAHVRAMEEHDIPLIDIAVINLYPFQETLAKGADFATCIENIDIGGPAMVRASAKNHRHVAIVTDPDDYDVVASEVEQDGAVSDGTRMRLAQKAFAMTAAFDAAVSNWLADETGTQTPTHYSVGGRLQSSLRYGENPHQTAAVYRSGPARPGAVTAEQLQGKALSYNNLNDTDAAFELIGDLGNSKAAVAIIKHANPCGVAQGEGLLEAYEAALRCDPVSAFGGIVALNGVITGAVAAKVTEIFTEVVIAPGADEEAKEIFAKKKNLRLLITGGLPDPSTPGQSLKPLAGGFLVQSRDAQLVDRANLTVVTKRKPNARELDDMLFAFRVAKHVKSNAIVYAKDGATVGIGAGQMSRLDSSRIAARKAQDAADAIGADQSLAISSVVASDAFFPFPDGLLAAAEAGATAVIQPGGSIKDDEVIAAADDAGLSMVFTGVRHFRH
ncbi:MAG: bifunctional phosphoribosylaminoimidazolecarboxamide formyltransferase/IMP cyclohydrolase [Pseudomonadota bacterium]